MSALDSTSHWEGPSTPSTSSGGIPEEVLAGLPATDHAISDALDVIATTPQTNRDGSTRTTSGGDLIYPSAAYLDQIVAAVRLTARLAGAADPVGASCQIVLRRHRRRQTKAAKQVAALDWPTADAAATVAAADPSDLAGLRDAAIISVMSDAMLRVSEASALDLVDVTRDGDGSGVVTIRRSKTDQAGAGIDLYLRRATVLRIDGWLAAAKIDPSGDGALFRSIRKGGHPTDQRLTARSIRRIITNRAAAVGIDGASGHSLRVGSAQSLIRSGAGLAETMQAGRWTNAGMVARYGRKELARKGVVARLRDDINDTTDTTATTDTDTPTV